MHINLTPVSASTACNKFWFWRQVKTVVEDQHLFIGIHQRMFIKQKQ